MNSEQPVLTVEVRGRVRVVRLNRPDALNAANAELHRRLSQVWRELEDDPECYAVVITGNGRTFSAGGDMGLLHDMNQDDQIRTAILQEGRQIVEDLVRFPLPLIAAVNGPAVGLGCSLIGFSDIVIMEQSAYLADPHVSVGLVAGDGGVLTWPALMSLVRAKEYLFTGDRIPASAALQLGLANRVVPDGTSLDEALSLADRLASQPAQALRDTKRAVNKTLERAMTDALDFAIAAESISSASREHGDIVDRFLRKRSAG
jgi:enoyl-CoA hydratase